MSRVAMVSLLLVSAAALTLAGCGKSSSSGPTVSKAPAAVASTEPVVAKAASGEGPDIHIDKPHYRIDITFPRLPASDAVLAKALRNAAASAREEFLKGVPDPKAFPEMADRQFQLKIDFSIAARMLAFVSVRERGMADTGGAHPLPIDASYVYAVKAGKLITLDDLFTDPDAARKQLSAIARKALEAKLLANVPGGARTPAKARAEWDENMRQMITQGTQPAAQNFAEFTVLAGAGDKASGIELIFSPYQVAPYVYGSQSVEVPVETIGAWLKPTWRDDFDL